MNFAKMKKLIKHVGAFGLVKDMDGEQWITDGAGWYAVEGMPELKLAHMPRVLGMELKEWDKVYIDESEELPEKLEDMRAAAESSQPMMVVTPAECSLKFPYTELIPFQGNGETLLFRKMSLDPLPNNEQTHYVADRIGGIWYMCVMDGMFVVAILREPQLNYMFERDANGIAAAIRNNVARYTDIGAWQDTEYGKAQVVILDGKKALIEQEETEE